MRAFIGVPLSAATRAFLSGVQAELAAARADVKWVSAEHLHVTMKFLGEITDEQQRAIARSLAQLAAAHPPFAVRVGGLGAFPSTRAPRVIWAGIEEGARPLAELAGAIERAGVESGVAPEERPFAAHVTLGRVRSSRHVQELARRLTEFHWTVQAPWSVDAVTLYQSVLSSSGPRYTVLAELPLGKSTAATA